MEDHTKIINELWEIINEKENSGDDNSYTYRTLEKGIKKASQKVGEKASELIIASLAETKKENHQMRAQTQYTIGYFY
jgi:phosphoribosyl-ATP pyrophosphohydrolase